MNLKKIAAFGLAAALATTMLASCTAKTPSSTPASSAPVASTPEATELKGEIKFSVWDLATTPYLQALADGFTAQNPGVTVKMVDTPSADYTTKLSVMLNGGSDVDVFLVKDSDTTLSLAQKGQLADLTDKVAKDGVDLASYNGLAENFTFDGKLSAMPFRTDYYVLYYNKEVFDAAKVPYPTNDMTWAQFEETAKKLTSGTGAEKVYGSNVHSWQALVQNWAVQDGKNTIMADDYTFFKPYYEMFLRMQNDDKSIKSFGDYTSAKLHYSGEFQSNLVGMMPMGTWYMNTHIAAIKKGDSKNKEWGVATIPHGEGLAAGSTVGSATPIAINAKSPNMDLAWEFVKFATSADGAKILADHAQIPACTNDAILDQIVSLEGMPEGAKEALAVKNIVLDRPMVDKVGDVNKMLGEEHSRIMLGEISIDEGIKTMGERAKEIKG